MITTIQERLINAIKIKDKPSVNILRDIKTQLSVTEKIKKKSLTKNDILDILKRMAKQRQQSIKACGDNYKYQELKQKELFELSIIEDYLPTQMSTKEINQAIMEIMKILKINPTLKNMGLIMKTFNEQYKGQDGKIVSKVVRECLSI